MPGRAAGACAIAAKRSYPRSLACGWVAAALHILLCVAAGRPELAASSAVSWAVFLLALGDQPDAWPRPAGTQRALGLTICAASALAAATLGVFDANDRDWRPGGAGVGVLSAARLAPLVFGVGLFLWRTPLSELRAHWRPLAALSCPLVTPVPGWLRLRIDPSPLSAWGAQQLLRLTGLPAGREGVTLLLPHDSLVVASECSGLGAVLQLLALALLLAVVTRAPKSRIALLVPLAVGIALFSNFARLAVLGHLLAREDFGRYDYWHFGFGSLLYPAGSAALLLAFALPLTLQRPGRATAGNATAAPAPRQADSLS